MVQAGHYRLFHVQKQKTCKKNIKMQQFNTSLNKQGKNRKQHSNSLKFHASFKQIETEKRT